MNTDLRKKEKNDFKEEFFKLMNNVVLGKRRTYLVSESNYHTTKFFTEHLLPIEMGKTKILVDKPVYLELSKNV